MQATQTGHRGGEDVLDDALARIHTTSPLWQGTLANHAPMAAEALIDLGQSLEVEAFLDRYWQNLEPAPAIERKRLDDWCVARGERTRAPELIGHFAAAIESEGVDQTVRDVLPTLFEGVLGGSLHGLLRTAHALRAWSFVDNAVRREEVAHGLGYWAAEYAPLRGEPGASPQAGMNAASALRGISPLPDDLAVDGIITVRASACAQSAAFLEEIRCVDFSAWGWSESISEVAGLAATLLLESSHRRVRFAYLHAVTSTSALRMVAPWLGEAQRAEALVAHWHALAAVHCMNAGMERSIGSGSVPPVRIPSGYAMREEDLAARAAATRDDHAIKLCSAAITEHRLRENPELLKAALSYVAACE